MEVLDSTRYDIEIKFTRRDIYNLAAILRKCKDFDFSTIHSIDDNVEQIYNEFTDIIDKYLKGINPENEDKRLEE